MKIKTSRNRWTWGFSEGAESWNGRLAMLAFMVIFLLEFFFPFLWFSFLEYYNFFSFNINSKKNYSLS